MPRRYVIVKCYYFLMLNSVDYGSTVLARKPNTLYLGYSGLLRLDFISAQLADTHCLAPWYRRSYSLLPAITGPTIFSRAFGWKSLQIGLATGGALTSGSFLGEFAGGWVVDHVMVS